MSVFRFCSPKRRKKSNRVTPYVYGSGTDRLHFFLQKELERISLLRSQEAELQQEEEEDVWRQWEEHRQQIVAEQTFLADKENQLQKELQDALAELEAVRKQLSSEQAKFRALMDEQVRRFLRANSTDLEWTPKPESKELGIQAMYDFAELVGEEKRLNGELSDKDKLLGIADLYGAELQSMRNSLDGQKKQLMHAELVQRLSTEDSLQDVKARQKNIEEMFLVNSQKIEGERKELEEKERHYQQQDSDKLQAINSQREKIERLEQRQRQLLLYIEEKEKEKYLPDSERVEPIGESCSEESLAGSKSARYSQPTKSSILKKHARSTSDSATFPKQRRYLSPVQPQNIQQSDEKVGLPRPVKPAPRVTSPKSKEKASAKQGTDKLYNSENNNDAVKQKKKAQESSGGHMRSKSAPALKSDKRNVPVGMVPSAPRLLHSSSSLASVPESWDEAHQRTDHDTSVTDTAIDISYDESSRMYDSESLRFSESDYKSRARSASPSISLAISGRSSVADQTQRSNVTSRGEGSGEEVRDDTRTTPEGLGEKLMDHPDSHIPYTKADLMKSDTFHLDNEAFDTSVHVYRCKEQSPSPMRTRQVSESPAGRGNSRGRGRAKERYIPGKIEKAQPRPGQNTSKTSTVMQDTKSSLAKRTPSKEDAQSPQLSRNSSKESGRSPQLGRSSSRESIGSNKSARSVSRSSVSSVRSDRSLSVASNKSEKGNNREAQLVHMDSASSVDSSSLSQTSSSQSGTKAKSKDSGSSDSKKEDKKKHKKSKTEKSTLGEKALSKPKKKKAGDPPVEIFIAGSSGGAGGTSLDMGDGEQPSARPHNDPAHELFAKSLRGGSIEKEYRPFTEEVFSSSDGAKYIIRRRQSDDRSNTPERSQGSSKPTNLAVERMISDDSHHSIPESMDSLENPAVLAMSLPNWKLARNDNGVYSDDSLDERLSPEGRKQSPRDSHSPATTNNSRSRYSYDSLDDENRSPSAGRPGSRSTPAPVSPTRLEPVVDCEVLSSGEYQPSHISVDSLMAPAEGLRQAPVQPDNGRESPKDGPKESPKTPKTSGKKREGSFRSSRKNRQQHHSPATAAENDVVVNLSDDSLASSGELKPSGSRPSSGSKRRRKPRPSSAKKSKTHSSEEYATSDNDSVYSEDSLGNVDDKRDDLLIRTVPQTAHHMASITENVESLTSAIQDDYTSDLKGQSEDVRDRVHVQGPKSNVVEIDFDSQQPHSSIRIPSPIIEYRTVNAPKSPKVQSPAIVQSPAEDRYFVEDIVIELDSDPSEALDGSSDFGSMRMSYGRELTPGRMSPPTHETTIVGGTIADNMMDTTVDTSMEPQEKYFSSSSSHSPASSTDSSPRLQDYLASSDQYSTCQGDADIQPSSPSPSGPINDSNMLEIDSTETDSKVPDVIRDYDPQLNTGGESKLNSLTDKLEMTQLDSQNADSQNADYSSAIEDISDAVHDNYSKPEESHANEVVRKDYEHDIEQSVDTEMPIGHYLDHKNDHSVDHASVMSPHVMFDATHVTSNTEDNHAIHGNRHETDSYDNVSGNEGSPTFTDKRPNEISGLPVRGEESDMDVEEDTGVRIRSPEGQKKGHLERVPTYEGLSPRSESLHESSESTVSNDTVIEAMRDSSNSSQEGETDMTDFDEELKSTPTHASYSAGALTEEEVMPLSTRWSSSDSAIDVVEDHPVMSHTSESETQRDSGAHSADDMLDDEYRPVKVLTQSKGQYNQDSVVKSAMQDANTITHSDILDNHKHDSIDPILHELTHNVCDKDVPISHSKLTGDLHPRDILVYSAGRQDDSVLPEIKLPREKPEEVISAKAEVSDPKSGVQVITIKEDEAEDVIKVVNLVPVNKDKPQANNRDSGYYSMPSESGLMSSSGITEADSSVNDVFPPHPTMGSPYPVFEGHEGQDFPFTSTPQGKFSVEANDEQETLFVLEDVNGDHHVTGANQESVPSNEYKYSELKDVSGINQTKAYQDSGSPDLGLNIEETDINLAEVDTSGRLSDPANDISGTLPEHSALDQPTSQGMFTPDPLDQTTIDHSDRDPVETDLVPGTEPSRTYPKQLTELNTEPQSSDTNTESQECSPCTEENKVHTTSGDSSRCKKNDEDTMDSSNSDSWSLEDTVRENNANMQKGWSFEDESLKLDLTEATSGNPGFSEYSTPRSDSTDAETTREVRSAIGQAVGQYALLHSMSVDSAASDDTLAAACDFEFNLDDTLVTIEDADEDEADEDKADDGDEDADEDAGKGTEDASDAKDMSLQLPARPKPILSPAASVSEEESIDQASDSDGEIMPLKNTLLDRLQAAKAADSDPDSKNYDYSDSFESDSSDDDDDNDATKQVYEAAASAQDHVLPVPTESAAHISGDLSESQSVSRTDDPNQVDNNQSVPDVLDLSAVTNDHVAVSDDHNTTSTKDTSAAADEQCNLCEGTQEDFTARQNTSALGDNGMFGVQLDPISPSAKSQEISLDEGYVTINNTADLFDESSTMNDISQTPDASHGTGMNRSYPTDEFELHGDNTDDETSVDELPVQSSTVEPKSSGDQSVTDAHISEPPLRDHVEQHSTPPLSPASSEANIAEPGVEVTPRSNTTEDELHLSDLNTQPLQDYDMPESPGQVTSDVSDAGEFTVVHFKAPEPETKKIANTDAMAGKIERAKELVQSQLLMLKTADVLHQQSQLLDDTYPSLPDEEDAAHVQTTTAPIFELTEVPVDEVTKSSKDQEGDNAMDDYEDDFESGPSSESGFNAKSEKSSEGSSGMNSDANPSANTKESYLTPPKDTSNAKASGSSKDSSIPEEIDVESASMDKSPSECVYEDDFEELTKSSTARSVEESLVSSADSSQQLSEDYKPSKEAMDDTTNLILKEIERTKQVYRISSGSSLAVEVGDPDTAQMDEDLEACDVTNAIHSPLKDDSLQSEGNGSLLSSADSKDVEDMIDPWNKVKVDNKRSHIEHQPSSLSMVAEMGDDQPEDVSVDVERMSDVEDEGSQKVKFAISEADLDTEADDEVNISDYEGLEEAEVTDGDDMERWTHISRKSEQSKRSAVSMVVNIGEQEDEAAVSGSEDEAQDSNIPADAAGGVGNPFPPVNGHLFEDHPDDRTSTTSGIASYDEFGRKTESSFQSSNTSPPAMPAHIPSTSALNSRKSSMESAWSTTPTVGDNLEDIDENSLLADIDDNNPGDTDLSVTDDVNDLINSVNKERNELRHGYSEDSPEDSPTHASKENEGVDVAAAEEQEERTPVVLTSPPQADKPEKLDTVLKKFLDEHEMTRPERQVHDAASESHTIPQEGGDKSEEEISKDVGIKDTTDQSKDEEKNSKRSKAEKPQKEANFLDSKVTGFDVNPWESVVRESPPLEDTTQQVVIGSQETLNVTGERKEQRVAGFQVLGLQPERVRDIPDEHYVFADEPTVPCIDHLKHSAINIEIRPWRMAEEGEYRPKSESLSSAASEEVTDISSDDNKAFVSAEDAQSILDNLKQMLQVRTTTTTTIDDAEDTESARADVDAEIIVGPEAEHPASFTSDAVLSNTGSTNPEIGQDTTDFGNTTSSDAEPRIHVPGREDLGMTMRFSQHPEIAVNLPSGEAVHKTDTQHQDRTQPTGEAVDTTDLSVSQNLQRPVSPGLDDLMKEVIAAEKEWLSIHGEDDAHSDRGSEDAVSESNLSYVGSDIGFDTCDADAMAEIFAEVSELPDILVTSEFSSLRDTWLNRSPEMQRSLSMSELELIEPRDRYEGISLSADCLIDMNMQVTKTLSSDSITYVFMSRPISCNDMVDLESWSPPHRRRSVPGFRRGTSVVEKANKRAIEEERSVSEECLPNKFTDTNSKYLSYSADASRFIQPPDPFLGREGDIFGPQDDDDTDFENEPTNFFAVSYDSNTGQQDGRSGQQSPNSLFDEVSLSMGSDSVFESTSHLASEKGMENLTTVGVSSENLSSDYCESEQFVGGAEKDKMPKKAVSWGHISECIEDRPFGSVTPKLKLVPGSPEESEINLLSESSDVMHQGRRRSRSLSPSHADQINNQHNRSNLLPIESTSQTGDSLEKVNRAAEDEAIRKNHTETAQLLEEALQTIHRGMGTQTDDLPTASVNMQTDSPQHEPREVSLGFRSDFSESRSSVGVSTDALGPTDSGVFDGQSTGASMNQRRHSDVPSRSSTERPLVLGHRQAASNQHLNEDYSSTYDSLRASSRSLPEEYYRYMASNPSFMNGTSQRTIETQTYPQVRYIETQTALQMRYIETQTDDELPSYMSHSMNDYINVTEKRMEEPLKVVVDTGVSPSPPLSPREFGSQTEEHTFNRTTETAIQTDPDVAVIRAASPEFYCMVAVGMQAGTPHLSAAEMTASSEDEDSKVIHPRNRSRSRPRELSDAVVIVDSSDDEDLAKTRKTEKTRTRTKPVFSEIRGVLGSNTVPTDVAANASVSPRAGPGYSAASIGVRSSLEELDHATTSVEETAAALDEIDVPKSEINAIEEEEEYVPSSVEVPGEDILPASQAPRTTFRASQNLIDTMRHQVSKLDQFDDFESAESTGDSPDFTMARSNEVQSGSASIVSDRGSERLSSLSPELPQNSVSTSADSSGSGTTRSSASSRMTIVTDDVAEPGSDADQIDAESDFQGDQGVPVDRAAERLEETNDVMRLETSEDQAVYISKLGDVVIDSSVPISDEDADKLRAAVQAGDEDLLTKTIEEINQSLSKPSQGDNASEVAAKSSLNEPSHSGTYTVTIPAQETSAFRRIVPAGDRRAPYTSSPSVGAEPHELERLGLSPVQSVQNARVGIASKQPQVGSVTVEPVTGTIELHSTTDVDHGFERPRSGAALSTVTQHKTPLVNGNDVIARSPRTVMGPSENGLTISRPRSRSASTQWEETGEDLHNTSRKSDYLTNGDLSPTTKDGRSPNASMKDEASETDFNDSSYDDELEQLRRERQRILDMLAKDMMPSKLQVELAEAQLNYIIGQTDTLLSNLDEPSVWDSDWLMQLGAPEAQLSEISQQHLARYRQTLEASRLEIERRIQHLERDRERVARSRDRSRAMEMMKRDAQMQAFKLEREREQITYERTKIRSPRSRSDSPDTRRTSLGSHSPIPHNRFSPAPTAQSSFTSQGPIHSTPLPPRGTAGLHGGPIIPDPPSYSSVMSQRSSQGSGSYASRSSRRDSQGSPAGSMFSSSSSFTSPDTLPSSHMTPKQRKEHLIGLRKNLLSSSGELRSRSESPATAASKSKPLPRSYSPMFTYSTFSSPPSTVTSPKKHKRTVAASTNYSLMSTAYPATDELRRETEERLSVKFYHERQRDGSVSDTASISSLISSLDDDSIQLLNEYQEVRGQADQEIIKAKETLKKKPSSGKKTPTNYLQRRLELESLKQQVEQSHQQHPTKDREELEKEIDSEIELLKLKYGSIGNNSSDASSRSSLRDKSPDGSSFHPPGGRTSTPQQDIRDTLNRYQSGSDTSATRGSALDASTWDSYLDSSVHRRTETNRSSYVPPARDSGLSYGRYRTPYSSSSSLASSYSYRSYASPYTGSSRPSASTRRPLHFTEPRSRGYQSKR